MANHFGSTPSSLNLLSSGGDPDRSIAPDEEAAYEARTASTPVLPGSVGSTPQLASGRSPALGSISGQAQGGGPTADLSVWQQSAHPAALFCLFLFRTLAIATYLLCGFFFDSYVFSTVIVVILLSADFWTVRNVSGRRLVGLRFWNQVDEDGTSYWVFESRDPSQPVNAVDSKLFWTALYAYPLAWIVLLFVGILKFNVSFIPIVILALVFNGANVVGYTYADRDAKKKWASGMAGSNIFGAVGGLGGSMVSGLARAGMGKILG